LRKITTLGEVLVEIMAVVPGPGFGEPLELVGPFPSGAPAIFIDQVARLGASCGIIAAVGDDDFGRLNVKRLSIDGVDTSAINIRDSEITGTAFVRYREDGQRDFIFNLRNSAAAKVELTEAARDMLHETGHLHVSGSSLFSPRMAAVVNQAIALVKAEGGSVSFDPNVRSGVEPGSPAYRALRGILGSCDMFLPGGSELTLLTQADNSADAISEILAMGVSCVVVKHGRHGSRYYASGTDLPAPGYAVEEVDPTGAGDCFDAAFVTCRVQGRSVEESLEYANAAGALAVGAKGPMEGTSTWAQLDEVRARRRPVGHRLSPAAARHLVALFAHGPHPLRPRSGITSICSGHPLVIEAAMLQARDDGAPLLIEATCNQVNHHGGYTGLTPSAFRDMVHDIARQVGYPRDDIVLGGDHLGPSPWRRLPVEEAMTEAETMVAAYAAAGYEKLHMDTSMGCQDEPEQLGDALTAERAASLTRVAERSTTDACPSPYYVIGTEVPAPGGALHDIRGLEVTRPQAVFATLEAHRAAFEAAGVEGAFERIIAVVAQPGVEFDTEKVVVYRPERAGELIGALSQMGGLVFEAHSTDYQPVKSLAELVRDGFAILKVGPGLTFAMREALYALDLIATEMTPWWQGSSLMTVMEQEMLAHPGFWEPYYAGEPNSQRIMRHFSYSDRIRYYWASPPAQKAVERLFDHLGSTGIPAPLVSQFLPTLYSRVTSGEVPSVPRALVMEAIRDVLRQYAAACATEGEGW
jgi:D-tagatose-bisphosphate aldolase class II non-catalytic subunit